jgi:hypothetical protein
MSVKFKSHMQQAAALAARYISPSLFAAIGVLLLTVIALFTPPYIGMADNGDYFRVLYSNGLYFTQPGYDSLYLGHFVKEYGILQYFNENGELMVTSHSLFIRFALLVNKLLVSGQVFDIRVQAAMLTLLYTAAVYMLVEAVTWGVSRKYGYAAAALAVFMFADTGYTAYFNSFFGESIVFIMMLFLFASWLLLYRRRYNDYVLLAVFVLSSLILTTSKQQNAPVGLIIAVMAVFLIFLRSGRTFRVLTAASLAGIFAAGVATYVLIPKEFVNINQYHAMTRGVLLDSDNPEKTLKTFGIDEQFAILKETIYYEQYATADVNSALLEENFYNRYGFGSILAFYATHPDHLMSILNKAAKNAFTIRPEAMGNYELSSGKPFQAQTKFFSAYSLIKKSASPKTFGFIVIWMLIITGIYMPSFIAAVRAKDPRLIQKMLLILTTIAMGLSGIFVSIIGAGDADLAKHEFLFTVAFDLVTFLVLSDAVCRSFSHRTAPVMTRPYTAPAKEGVATA